MNKLVLATHECSREKKILRSNDLLLRIVYTVANAQSHIGRNLRLCLPPSPQSYCCTGRGRLIARHGF